VSGPRPHDGPSCRPDTASTNPHREQVPNLDNIVDSSHPAPDREVDSGCIIPSEALSTAQLLSIGRRYRRRPASTLSSFVPSLQDSWKYYPRIAHRGARPQTLRVRLPNRSRLRARPATSRRTGISDVLLPRNIQYPGGGSAFKKKAIPVLSRCPWIAQAGRVGHSAADGPTTREAYVPRESETTVFRLAIRPGRLRADSRSTCASPRSGSKCGPS
jgi:hypothetical protein